MTHGPKEQYCSLQHRNFLPSPVTSTTAGVFVLASSLHSLCSYFSTDLQSHIGHLPTWGVHLSVSSIFLPFHGVPKARILKWFASPSPVDHDFSELSTMTHPSWVALHSMAHSFIELDKAVVLCRKEWLIFCDCGFQSVCPLMEKDKRPSPRERNVKRQNGCLRRPYK